jgi:hypothetical protein
MRSLGRRIADGRILHVIKRWLTAPVVEVIDGRSVQTAEARRTKRAVADGEDRTVVQTDAAPSHDSDLKPKASHAA